MNLLAFVESNLNLISNLFGSILVVILGIIKRKKRLSSQL